MSKKFIWILSILMSITMLWFIYIQIKWIDGALEVRERQFVHLVNTSLRIVAKEVEEHEIISRVKSEVTSYDIDSIGNHIHLDKNFLDTNDKTDNVYFKIENKTIFIENIVNEIVRKKINIDERVNRDNLNKKIKTVFDHHNITFEYEFAVVTKSNNLCFKTDSFNLASTDEIFEVMLYPNDVIYKEKHYIKLYFPHEKEDIFFTLPKVALSTLFLILAIITIFFITIYIILKQKKLSEMKNDFINNLTHELKTPISTISLASQMLKDNSISVVDKDYNLISNIIDDETKRLGFQVEKILQMAIIEKGYVKFSEQDININELLSSVIKSFSLKISQKNGIAEEHLNAEISDITGDRLHITNVFYNLIENAIKYSSKKDLLLKISTKKIKNKIIISIQDNAIGIKKDDQKRIFNKFYRVSTGNVHNVKGFGLGLSYVKRIVEEHKGRISIESQLNKGTTFKVVLPLKKEKFKHQKNK